MKVEVKSKATGSSIHIERVIGEYTQNIPGPILIFVGGIHGNEPSGVIALKQVFVKLIQSKPVIKGSIYGFAGNLTALGQNLRYVEEDLNRIWKTDRMEEINNGKYIPENESIEGREQKELYEAIKSATQNNHKIYIFDLHTTSSESQPFITIGDTLRNRFFAMKFPIPVILGIEEQLEGTLLSYVNGELGYITMGFESGQHEALSSIQIHIALIWLVLQNAKCIDPKDIPNLEDHYRILNSSTNDRQKIFEIRYRYDISELKEFKMNPGFQNFQKINKGTILAKSELGDIPSLEKGMVFLPLYQAQGDDGFFVVKQIVPFWLKVSAFLRKRRIDRILPYLPGIKKDSENANTLIVNTKIARWFVVELFHLLGFRKEMRVNGKLIVTKRKYDTIEP